MNVIPGFEERHRGQVADLFWSAFADKLMPSLGPREKGVAFIAGGLRPEFAFSAIDGDGRLLGVAGIKTEAGGLLAGTYRDLSKVYGPFQALWRSAILEQFERKLQPGILQMDGIFVADDARGQGVGSALLEAVAWTARMNRCHAVRLDVVDGNVGAKRLYERRGFRAVGQVKAGFLAPVLGFSQATTMELPVGADPA